jgi:TonB family protein
VALGIHSLAAITVLRVHVDRRSTVATKVEIDVNEPPPPEVRPEAPPEAPPPPTPPAAAKVLPRRSPARELPSRAPASQAPLPPNQAPPPETKRNAPPVFGVTMSSVVSGEATLAVPVGNTTMTKSRTPASDHPAEAYPSQGGKSFVPAPEADVAAQPRVLHEVNSDDVYPPEARNLGIEGSVDLSVDTDEKGNVVQVRALGRAGHRFDEAAVEAMKKFVFSPARAHDGRPVPYRFHYRFTFTITN